MEVAHIFLEDLRRVARGIDGDEDRLHLGGALLVVGLEPLEPGADHLKVDGHTSGQLANPK
jgi:hypothetical protein